MRLPVILHEQSGEQQPRHGDDELNFLSRQPVHARRLNGEDGFGKRACKSERRRSIGLTRKKIRDGQNESDNEHES